MFDLYLTGPFVPFTIALALLFGLLALEILLLLIGSTLLGMGADADLDVDVDTPDLGDLDIDFGDVDMADFEIADLGADAEIDVDIETDGATGVDPVGPATWLGIGKMPILIWIAAVLMAFGVVGVVLQHTALGLFGFALPAVLIAVPAGLAALWFAARFGNFFASVLPQTETTALSERHLGRRTGTVTQGTAKRGRPAEVRVSDRYGNMHHLRGEPLKDDDIIPAGTDVLVLRHRLTQGYRLVPLGP